MKNKKLIILMTLLLVNLIFLSGCDQKDAASQAQKTPASPVKSEGQIVAEGEVVPLQYVALTFTQSGVVNELLIKEGDQVKKDQLMARLDGKERLESSVTSSELAVLTSQQALDDLRKNSGVKKAEAEKALADAEKTFKDAKDERERMGLRWGSQNNIDQAYANLVVAEQGVKDAQKNFDDYASWRTEDDVIRASFVSQLAAARNARERAQAQLDYAKGAPDSLELAKADSKIEVAKATMEKARVDLEKLIDGIDPTELSLAEARLKDSKAKLEASKDALKDLELKASIDGVVITNNLKVGELASPTSPQVTLADISTWKIETTDLTELNVVGVKEGTPAIITFDAIPGLELTGVVERIKSLGVNKQGDITYTVVIKLDKQDERMRWKMTASVKFQKNQ